MSIFKNATSLESLEWSFHRTFRGKNKHRNDAILFAQDETANLLALHESLQDKSYAFGDYAQFTVYEPKERIIYAPGFKDKVVQLALDRELKEFYVPKFIKDSYASIPGRGTHTCVDRLSYFMRQAKWDYGEDAFIVKLDVSRFFYSINRRILKEIYAKKITCPDAGWLLGLIIDSAGQISAKGLPLGNAVSQISANVYMDQLDQYAKRRLSLKYYVRYMDDVMAILPNREAAREALEAFEVYLTERLDLVANPKKTKIFPLAQGLNMVGFKIHPTHRLLRDDSKRRIKRKARKMPGLIERGDMDPEKAEEMLNSWLGHAKHGSSYNFIQSLIKRNPHIYMDHNGQLRIRRDDNGLLQR